MVGLGRKRLGKSGQPLDQSDFFVYYTYLDKL